ncbi:PepSY domain-containing protein [Erwinia sp. S43]|uniref:PepSY-associated TM helix domain-containing protein n=1 Tax=unclassified Erwinia TaxID=2622719 RepID=UPI00190C18AA|nr:MULTISPECIES: PepSY-associated TM helix domain-containing protein [unclassified Erwinia]MBK0034794.1 PepSY domain-containing protein [Erwinia sp. S43]MCW1874465.1 PepSY domain-containing protein [Erwinia sp. INIA01]
MSQIKNNDKKTRGAVLEFFRRLHFYIGLFVGPFIFVAALTGTLYVFSTQIESRLYAHELTTQPAGEAHSLADQISAARAYAGEDTRIYAVRPAPGRTDTTRVQFVDPVLGSSESRAVFVDPYSLEIRGDLTVYGSSGSLPLRKWIDQVHRGLLLGDTGRLYSELAASWMWVAAVGGVVLWWLGRPKRRLKKAQGRMAASRRLHITLGLFLLAGLLMFSATGLTWSQWAGGNIDKMRSAFNWLTPQVRTTLDTHAVSPAPADPHAEHHMSMAGMVMPSAEDNTWQQVLASARRAGIDAPKVEIRGPKSEGKAWTVAEAQARWPSQVDVVAIDPRDMRIVDRVYFDQYPLAAKLTRWGIDFHMGLLFGLANQLLLTAFGIGVCVMIVLGYRMWWLRRPTAPADNVASSLLHTWLRLPMRWRIGSLLVTSALGWCLPVMGASLLAFLLIDVARWQQQKRQVSQFA